MKKSTKTIIIVAVVLIAVIGVLSLAGVLTNSARKKTTSEFFGYAGITVEESAGGEVVYKGLKERGVLVRFWNTEKLKDFCRITVGMREEHDRLLSALKELLSAFCAV